MLFAQLRGGLGNILFIVGNLFSLSIDREMDYCVTNFTVSCTVRKEEADWLKTILKSVKKTNKRPTNVRARYKERGFNHQRIPNSKGKGLEVFGYWQSSKYLDHNKEKVIELFTEYKKDIQKSLDKKFPKNKKTIGVHLRRGDYLKLQHAHVVQTEEYYKQSLEKLATELKYESIKEMNKDYKVVVFSDDINWCQNKCKLFKSLKDVCYMARNSPVEDLYLMSMCNHNVIANSTFSWWGAYLNTNEGNKVIAPKLWFNPNYMKPEKWADVYCKDWILV